MINATGSITALPTDTLTTNNTAILPPVTITAVPTNDLGVTKTANVSGAKIGQAV